MLVLYLEQPNIGSGSGNAFGIKYVIVSIVSVLFLRPSFLHRQGTWQEMVGYAVLKSAIHQAKLVQCAPHLTKNVITNWEQTGQHRTTSFYLAQVRSSHLTCYHDTRLTQTQRQLGRREPNKRI